MENQTKLINNPSQKFQMSPKTSKMYDPIYCVKILKKCLLILLEMLDFSVP